jgi:hypothetical protein
LKRGLVMAKVAELEKLEVSQMEVLEQAKLMADMYGGGDRMWQSLLATESRQNTISNDLLSNKVIHRLAAIAKGQAPEPGAEEPAAEAESAGEADSPDIEVEPVEPATAEITAETESTEPALSDAPAESDQAAAEATLTSAEGEAEATEPIPTEA